ncbi:hypothetical protein [Chondromyces crocatus]|nr:hypothetical protein [Chondromyces crocatus]
MIAETRFENEVVDDLQVSFPDLFAMRGDLVTRALVRLARQRAALHGFTLQVHVTQYIGLAFVLGADFDTDEAFPWAARLLGDPTLTDPAQRIARLASRTRAHLRGLALRGAHA